jgi:hypothetical protein
MGGIFTTNVDAEHETPPIANVLLVAGFSVFLNVIIQFFLFLLFDNSQLSIVFMLSFF